MSKVPQLLSLLCHVIASLLVLLPTMDCRRSSSNRKAVLSIPNQPVLRVTGIEGVPADLLVWMADPGKTNYCPPPYGGLPDSDPYMIARGPEKGGVHLMCEGGRQVKEFVIPRREIKAIVRMRFDMDVVDWTDVVITRSNVFLIHTSYANAGLFLPSEVYVFPSFRNSFDYLNMMQTRTWRFYDVRLLYPALLFYETANGGNWSNH